MLASGDSSLLDQVLATNRGQTYIHRNQADAAKRLLNQRGRPANPDELQQILQATATAIGRGDAISDTWSPFDFIGPGLLAGVGRALLGRAFAQATVRTSSGALVDLTEATFKVVVEQGPRNIAGYELYATEGLVGSVYNYNIFSVKRLAGNSFREFVAALEQKAVASGANKVSIAGLSIMNKGFLNKSVARRFGYTMDVINEKTVILQKILR